MTTVTDLIAEEPFRRALAACLILSISTVPLGLFVILRRMTLVGDAISHAILPGVAIAWLIAGLNIWSMTVGGLAAGVAVVILTLLLCRFTDLKQDAGFTLVYMMALAGGTMLITLKGGDDELVHMLFGNALEMTAGSLWLIAGIGCITAFVLAAIYRGLVLDCFDPEFLQASRKGRAVGQIFFVLLVINLVAAFQALGTLMALGLMILPALASRFWTRQLDRMLPISMGIAAASSVAGLLLATELQLPTGPAIVLVAGGMAVLSALIGRYGSVRCYRHS